MFHFVLSLIFSFSLKAVTLEKVEVLQKSSTGKTIVLNRGSDDGVMQEDLAEFFSKKRSKKLSYQFSGKVIKVLNNKSYWLVQNVTSRLVPKTLYLVRKSLNGKGSLRLSAKSIQKTKEQSNSLVKASNEKGNPLDLVFGEDAYYGSNKIKETAPLYNSDLEFVQLKTLQEDGKDLYTKKPYYVVESLPSDSIVKKTIKEVEENIARENIKSSVLKRQKVTPSEKEFIEKPSDSASYSDEELRDLFLVQELKKERKRFEESKDLSKTHEVLLSYRTGLSQSQGTNTDQGYSGYNYNYSLSYEYYLMKTWESLRNWSLEVGLGKGTNYYNSGSSNSSLNDLYAKAYINWYFLHSPASIERYIAFVGTGIKRGSSTVFPGDSSSHYNYDVLSIPGIQAGLKYRFFKKASDPVGFGLHLLMSYETLRYSASGELGDGMLSSFSFTDAKFGMGMNIFF